MSHVVSLSMAQHDSSFWGFGAGSVMLHLGTLGICSLLYVTAPVEKPKHLVNITLLETPAPVSKDIQADVPPMRPTQQPAKPSQPLRPAPQQLRLPPEQHQLTRVLPESRTPRQARPPLTRRILHDQRAIDTLRLNHFTKVAARRTPHPASTKVHTPVLALSATPPIMPTGISTPLAPSTPSGETSTEALLTQPKLLRSAPMESKGHLKSGVGLGHTIPPVYPRVAQKAGWEGTVTVRAVVQPDGRPDPVTVQKSSGHTILDETAVKAVKTWQFRPARDGNIPVRSTVEIPIRFDLRQQR